MAAANARRASGVAPWPAYQRPAATQAARRPVTATAAAVAVVAAVAATAAARAAGGGDARRGQTRGGAGGGPPRRARPATAAAVVAAARQRGGAHRIEAGTRGGRGGGTGREWGGGGGGGRLGRRRRGRAPRRPRRVRRRGTTADGGRVLRAVAKGGPRVSPGASFFRFFEWERDQGGGVGWGCLVCSWPWAWATRQARPPTHAPRVRWSATLPLGGGEDERLAHAVGGGRWWRTGGRRRGCSIPSHRGGGEGELPRDGAACAVARAAAPPPPAGRRAGFPAAARVGRARSVPPPPWPRTLPRPPPPRPTRKRRRLWAAVQPSRGSRGDEVVAALPRPPRSTGSDGPALHTQRRWGLPPSWASPQGRAPAPGKGAGAPTTGARAETAATGYACVCCYGGASTRRSTGRTYRCPAGLTAAGG